MSVIAQGDIISSKGSKYAAKDLAVEELVAALGETTPALLWMGNAEGKCVFLNAAQREFWGVNPQDLKQFDWNSTIHPDDIPKLAGPFMEGMAEQKPFVVEARYRRADGAYRILRTNANPRFAEDGCFLGMTGVNTDITEQRAAEEHNGYIMGELNHRVKNILMVVQAVTRQTARNTSPENLEKVLFERIQNLAASNDLLFKSDWSGVSLGDLVSAQMGVLPENTSERLSVSGPPISIGPSEAQTIGMTLHELTTNSLKYGALADPAGCVALSWKWNDQTSNAWQLEWREDVTTPITEPKHKGFGHTVLVDMVTSALGAEVEMDYASSGLIYMVKASKGACR